MIATAPQNSVFQSYVGRQPNNETSVSAFTRPAQRVRLNGYPCSSWNQALASRFDSLTKLAAGWDGYAGQPVSFGCAQFAAQLLERLCDDAVPPPSLVPGSDGTLQLEWHRNGYDIEVDILAPYKVVASRFDCLTQQVGEELELETDFAELASWIIDMKSDRAPEQLIGAVQH